MGRVVGVERFRAVVEPEARPPRCGQAVGEIGNQRALAHGQVGGYARPLPEHVRVFQQRIGGDEPAHAGPDHGGVRAARQRAVARVDEGLHLLHHEAEVIIRIDRAQRPAVHGELRAHGLTHLGRRGLLRHVVLEALVLERRDADDDGRARLAGRDQLRHGLVEAPVHLRVFRQGGVVEVLAVMDVDDRVAPAACRIRGRQPDVQVARGDVRGGKSTDNLDMPGDAGDVRLHLGGNGRFRGGLAQGDGCLRRTLCAGRQRQRGAEQQRPHSLRNRMAAPPERARSRVSALSRVTVSVRMSIV